MSLSGGGSDLVRGTLGQWCLASGEARIGWASVWWLPGRQFKMEETWSCHSCLTLSVLSRTYEKVLAQLFRINPQAKNEHLLEFQ